jgi:hypothetical protein
MNNTEPPDRDEIIDELIDRVIFWRTMALGLGIIVAILLYLH